MKSPKCGHSNEMGFTLLEAVASLAILVLMAGGVYAVAVGAIGLSKASEEARVQQLRLTQFMSLLRTAFLQLPYRAQIVIGPPNARGDSVLAFQNAPGIFAWLPRKQAEGQFSIRLDGPGLILEEGVAPPVGRSHRARTILLLPGARGFRWRNLDSASGEWVAPEGGELYHPSLLELTLWMDGAVEPERHVFAVSRVAQTP